MKNTPIPFYDTNDTMRILGYETLETFFADVNSGVIPEADATYKRGEKLWMKSTLELHIAIVHAAKVICKKAKGGNQNARGSL
jgi:hypothetical protein